MEFFKEEYISITVPAGTNQTHVEWWGMPSADQYKLGCDKILEAINQNNSTTILVNYFDLESYLDLEVQVWTINVWFSQLIHLGVAKFGVLIPSKIMAQMVIKSIFAGANASDIDISYFEAVEDMHSWANVASPVSEPVGATVSQGYNSGYATTTAAPIPPPPAPAAIPPPPPPVQQNSDGFTMPNNPTQAPQQEQPQQPPVQQQQPVPNTYAPPKPPNQPPPPPFNLNK